MTKLEELFVDCSCNIESAKQVVELNADVLTELLLLGKNQLDATIKKVLLRTHFGMYPNWEK